MVSPDGRELTRAETVAWHAGCVDAEMGLWSEIAAEPGDVFERADLRALPVWVQFVAVAVVVGLLMNQAFLAFLIFVVWCQL